MRQSYTVTVPEEPPAAAFPFLKQEMRRKGSMSGSVLVSTFVGLLINQAKVRDSTRCVPLPLLRRERHSKLHTDIRIFSVYTALLLSYMHAVKLVKRQLIRCVNCPVLTVQ